MSNLSTSLPRSCQHEDVGDCEPECWGNAGQHVVKCCSCNEYFDLNVEGRCESNKSLLDAACDGCKLPSQWVLPRLSPSLAAQLELEEGLPA